jgi:hypothetical protein
VVHAGMEVAVGRTAERSGLALVSAGHDVTTFRVHSGTPLSLPHTISASKYPVFPALRDGLPRKYLKRHIVAYRNKTTKGLEAGAGDREPWTVDRGPRSG